MKISAIQSFRRKLNADIPVHGLWVTLESASISEMAVALGLDWIVIDAEHGHLDWKHILEHIRATARSQTVALVRIAELNGGLIKRALDIGADGIVIPWIETGLQLQQALEFAWYPPEGKRGIGGERATGWGQCFLEHAQEANDHVLVVPIIESVTAGRNLDQLAQFKNIETFFFGPADYSATAGYRGHWEGPGVAAELRAIKDGLRARGKHCGILTRGADDLAGRTLDGFRMLGLGSDAGLFLKALRAQLGVVGRDRPILPSLAPEAPTFPATALGKPPEAARPDRGEAMAEPSQQESATLAPGVQLNPLVGARNGARRLFTALVDFEPQAELAYHTHSCGEAITVLEGSLIVGVEGREYTLTALDNIAIPRHLTHTARNASRSSHCVVHVAFAAPEPDRQLAAAPVEITTMPGDASGIEGKEYVSRFASAPRFEAGPGTTFIDYFNRDLLSGFELSGGYGLFQPGGRLPAHFHDFDESICIIEGAATCVVEGRRHAMHSRMTALQPRGRVHYFINESERPMAMIWVYAGPVPQRIVVDERCATTEGDPWRAR